MGLRILHIGNIAGNAYNIAKALRQRSNIEADVFTHDYRYFISDPEWEDGDIEPVRFDDPSIPIWSEVDLKGFRRPEWYAEQLDGLARRRLRQHGGEGPAAHRGRQAAFRRGDGRIPAAAPRGAVRGGFPPAAARTCATDWRRSFPKRRLRRTGARWVAARYEEILDKSFAPLGEKELERFVRGADRLASLFARYDIIQTYGVCEPMWPLLLAPSVPRVTFEHGSMREHPFQGDLRGKLWRWPTRRRCGTSSPTPTRSTPSGGWGWTTARSSRTPSTTRSFVPSIRHCGRGSWRSTAAGKSSSPSRGTTGRSRGTTSSSAASPCSSGEWAAAQSSSWPIGARKWSGAGRWCGN